MISEICVVIPAYNASKTIKSVVTSALKHVNRVIVVDDGSNDSTAIAATEAGAKVIVTGKNKGKGNALKVLFQSAMEQGYKAVISMDADGQHDPEEIPHFIRAYNMYPDAIIVGSRMHEKEKIPRSRYNSMHIARFYISFAANQFIEDTQCGFRLYPLPLIRKMQLTTDGYVTETEILMKAGDMGAEIRFVNIKAIYCENKSHFRPVTDVTNITAYVIFYLTIKWLIEGVSPNRPFTYKKNNIRDIIVKHKITFRLLQGITVLATLPFSLLCLIEYVLLSPIFKNNFASVRRVNCGFSKITLASHMLPVVLIFAIIEKLANSAGFTLNFLDRFIERFFPYIWQKASD